MDPYVEMLSIVQVLQKQRISYALCGALALSVHGHPRFTKDIDLLILPRNIEKTKKAVASVGFNVKAAPMTFRSGTEFETRVHRVSKFAGEDHLMLDLIEVGKSLAGIWKNRESYKTKDGELVSVSPQGLILMKHRAGRMQDLADIERIEGRES